MQFACDLASVEFTKVAEAGGVTGVRGFRVEDPTEMRNTVHAALDPTDLRGSRPSWTHSSHPSASRCSPPTPST